ncbi:MAG: ligase-associated DNA damage response DEXH box helicase, partial [Alphaproteobacteria bacterium]|nr:ligase-associated DNA damage response DEXH box helicase [Alphaproteobacteria bacterium]
MSEAVLPTRFKDWFAHRGWTPRPHQLALLDKVAAQRSTLLIAPTGAGKTLAGFLPSLVTLSETRSARTQQSAALHTLYISPLKALAVDVTRNLHQPIADLDLPIRCESRTGDTPANRRQRQRTSPPDLLLTTPEQVALMLSHPDAKLLFGNLITIIVDELHALSGTKRGDLLSLNLARLRTVAPGVTIIGLSATVARPAQLRAYLHAQHQPQERTTLADSVVVPDGAKPRLTILELDAPVPWSGHSARYAIEAIYEAISEHRTTIVFVNTRMQAELVFQELWRVNDDALPIALHHGSLDVGQRRKVEAAMVAGRLRSVVATSTLDLGVDWGDVDLVINVGAPKGASRLMQRIGRANHRLEEPSQALLVPANRFEVLECRAALDAALAGEHDTPLARSGALDVLAQHILGMACQAPFDAQHAFDEVRSAAPYSDLDRKTFDRVLDYVATGGYALKSYERYAKLRQTEEGLWRLAHPRIAKQYRMNVGTIVETPMIKVRLGKPRKSASPGAAARMRGGRVLGEVEEGFIEQLRPGDTFAFAGQILRFEALAETDAWVTRSSADDAMIPSFVGGKFPLSTHLAKRVRHMLADRTSWNKLPAPVSEWLHLQAQHSALPDSQHVLVETFPRGKRHYLVAYPFEGRLAHQTLGMLLTRRLDRAGARPLGFVANDYGLALWCINDLSHLIAEKRLNLAALFEQDMLGDDLDAWLADASLMKRTFRTVAVIAGLIERRHPGQEKTGRQVTMSTDLIYDVLRKH